MIAEIVALSLKFRVLIIGVAIGVIGLSAYQLPSAPVDALPEFSPPMVQIQTEALGLSASEVESLITVPLEQDLLNGVAWLDQIHSESAPGLSSIDLIFEPGTDILKARQLVQERLTQAHALPNVGSPPAMIQPLSSTSRVMMIGLTSKELSLIDLSVLARWQIRPRLMGVPGVANVAIWGQRDRQLQVQVDPEKLRQNGVTLDQVITTAGNALWVSPLTFVEASTPGTGGFIDTATQRFAIQHVLPISTARELASVTIEDTGGRTLRLDQVATVVEDHQPLIGDAVLADGPGLMLVVQKFPNASTSDVTKGVEAALAALRPGLSGVQIDTREYQAQTFIDSAMQNLGLWAIAGLLLLVVIVALALSSWRVAVISLATILMSLLLAAYAIYLSGAPYNLMALAGLAVAMSVVIGDAIIDVLRIRRRLRAERLSGNALPSAAVVAAASSSVRTPLLYASAILLLASLPLLYLDGVAGSFTRPAVLAFTLGLLSSMVVTLTVTPTLAFLLLSKETLTAGPRRPVMWANRLFDATVSRSVGKPRWAVVTMATLALVGSAMFWQLGTRPALPTPQDRNLLVHWEAAPGTSLPEMVRLTTSATAELRSIGGVEHVGAHVGRAITGDQVVNVNSAELWISISPSADYDQVLASIGRTLRGYPTLRSEILTYAADRVRAVQAGADDAVVVRIYGQEFDLLRKKADEVRQLLSTVDGVTNPTVQAQNEEPTLEIQVNLKTAQQFGLKPGDIRRAATTFYSGLLVGNLYEEQKVFDVVVQGPPSMRTDPNKVADLMIDTPAGGRVRLGEVARVKIIPYPTVIRHDATSRSLDVTAGVSGRDLGAVLSDVSKLVATVQMPLEYHAEVVSAPALQQGRDLRTAGLAIGVAIVIFLLLQAALGSWRLALLLFAALPLATVGGVLAAPLAGGLMTFGALAGIFTILAITVRNGILMIRDFQRADASGALTPGLESIVRSTRENAGPIALVACAIGLAVLPLVILGKAPGAEILNPFAVVTIGGLVSSTVVTLLVLPPLYVRLSATGVAYMAVAPTTDGEELTRKRSVHQAVQESEVVAEPVAPPDGGSG